MSAKDLPPLFLAVSSRCDEPYVFRHQGCHQGTQHYLTLLGLRPEICGSDLLSNEEEVSELKDSVLKLHSFLQTSV